MGGAVFERALQLQHHLAGAVTLEPFVGDRRAGDIAAQVLQFLALIGAQRTAAWRLKPCALARSSGADGLSALGTLCKLNTFCPARGPSAMR